MYFFLIFWAVRIFVFNDSLSVFFRGGGGLGGGLFSLFFWAAFIFLFDDSLFNFGGRLFFEISGHFKGGGFLLRFGYAMLMYFFLIFWSASILNFKGGLLGCGGMDLFSPILFLLVFGSSFLFRFLSGRSVISSSPFP